MRNLKQCAIFLALIAVLFVAVIGAMAPLQSEGSAQDQRGCASFSGRSRDFCANFFRTSSPVACRSRTES
jgi:hypothetical protein